MKSMKLNIAAAVIICAGSLALSGCATTGLDTAGLADGSTLGTAGTDAANKFLGSLSGSLGKSLGDLGATAGNALSEGIGGATGALSAAGVASDESTATAQ